MATLNKEFIEFDKEIKLNENKKLDLKTSKKNIRKNIQKWFNENKPNEIQPKFHGQGSFEMNTGNNPIIEYDNEGNKIYKYDLDYGVYFIEKEGEDNKKNIDTWHDWLYQSVENYTSQKPIRKNTCIRVIFADGHHIDLPIYYKLGDVIEIAHRSKGWCLSDPKLFYEWFNDEKKKKNRLESIVRCLKAWKNFRDLNNTNLKLPSGFELTILATNNYVDKDNLDDSFRETVRAILVELKRKFECLRPTTPKAENVFESYSQTRKNDFLNVLESLLSDCDRAKEEKNYKKATERLRDFQFGYRFPFGNDEDEETQSNKLYSALGSSMITPKPYGY
jgi:hypothetical protein